MNERSLTLAFTFAIALVVLGGCAVLQEDGGREFEPTWPSEADMPKPTNGSIYAQGTEVSLWENVTARMLASAARPSSVRSAPPRCPSRSA